MEGYKHHCKFRIGVWSEIRRERVKQEAQAAEAA
jgi:hypothetical protein